MCQGGKPGTGKLNTNVAPPTPVGAWSMALGLRQRFEYYIYIYIYRGVSLYQGFFFHKSR